jgi:hypothetical protein
MTSFAAMYEKAKAEGAILGKLDPGDYTVRVTSVSHKANQGGGGRIALGVEVLQPDRRGDEAGDVDFEARLERAFREPELDADPHSLPVSSVLSCGVAPVYLVFDQPRPTSRCGDGVYGAVGVYCYRVFHLSPRGSALGLTAVEPGRRTIELQDAAGKRLGTTTVRLDPGESLNLDGLVSTRHARWDLSIGGIAHSGTASRYLPAAAGELELSWVDPLRAPAWLSADLHLRAGLGRGQVAIDRHVIQPGAAGRPHHGVVVLVVLHQDRDGVALAQASLTKQVRQPIRPRLQFAEGDDGAAGIEDDGGFVRRGLRMLADLHAWTLLSPPRQVVA